MIKTFATSRVLGSWCSNLFSCRTQCRILGLSHDLQHAFNASLVVDDFASSIWSEHDHRAGVTALVFRQNCAFCVSDFKIDAHGVTFSVDEGNIAFDTRML